MGIPVSRIYTINPKGQVVRQKLSQELSTSYVDDRCRALHLFISSHVSSYKNLHEIVDLLFPPMDCFSAGETYSLYTYWREEPAVDQYEEDMRAELEELAQRQKANKSNAKKKSLTNTSSAASTPTTGALPKTTPTTTVVKPNGEKLLTIAQATENTVKRA